MKQQHLSQPLPCLTRDPGLPLKARDFCAWHRWLPMASDGCAWHRWPLAPMAPMAVPGTDGRTDGPNAEGEIAVVSGWDYHLPLRVIVQVRGGACP